MADSNSWAVGIGGIVVEDRRPSVAAVHGFPETARAHGHVPEIVILRMNGDVGDASREPDQHPREGVLADVVAKPENQGPVDRLIALRFGGDGAFGPCRPPETVSVRVVISPRLFLHQPE